MAGKFITLCRDRQLTLGLALLGLAALGLRLGVLLVAGVHAEGNAFEHGEIAENLLAGRGFSVRFLGVEGPTSQQAPLYPALLAAAKVLFGPQHASLAIEILQCAAGAVTAMLVASLTWNLLPQDRITGWIAGSIAAVFPPHVYLATQIQVVVWAVLLLTLLVTLAAGSLRRHSRWRAGGIGLVAGLLLLVEPILALVVPIAAVLFWQGECRSTPRGTFSWRPLGRVALMTVVATLVVTPWLIRNFRVHGEFVFVKSTFGYAFWQGNNASSWGTDKIPKAEAERIRTAHDGTLAGIHRALWEARHETIYIDDVLLQPGQYREFQGLTEPQRSRLLFDRARREIAKDPNRYAKLCLQRLKYFLLFDETNPKAANRLYRATTVTWLVLAALGVLVSRKAWRTLWPTYAIFVVVSVFHSLTITSARFRMPLEPLTFLWIAAALAPLLTRFGERTVHGAKFVAQALSRARGTVDALPTAGRSVPRPHMPLHRSKTASRPATTSQRRPID